MKKKSLKQLMSLAIAFLSCIVSAQTGDVTGTVSDVDGPLPGVNIVVKGTTNGVTTDFDGNYTISNVESDATLMFSYIGYANQEIAVAGKSVINVTLAADAQALTEVVLVGYGTSNKRELTGAVSTIKAKEITNVVASNPTTALQGKLSGIQVESFGGQPGGKANVFIRGINSLSNADPLFIVDGLFVDGLEYVNPNDIKDISVLKDAAAAAIYGVKSANGVVLITTNHGRRNQALQVQLSTRVGFDAPSKKLDFINGQQYTDYLNQVAANDGTAPVTFNGVDTDWQKESLQTGLVEDYGVTISGGGEKSSYFASLNYFNQDGILVGSGFKRLNMRLNSKHEFGKFRLTQSTGVTEGKLQENNWYGFDGTTAPTVALSTPGNLGGFEAPSIPVQGPGGVNQFALATLEDNLETTRTLFTSLKLDYDITDDLTASANLGLDYTNRRNYQFTPTFFMSQTDAVRNVNDLNDLTDFRQTDLNVLFEPTINYKKTIGNHKVSALLGSTYYRERQTGLGVYGQGTAGNNIRNVGSLPSNEQVNLLGEDNTATLISYFGRLNYGFDDRYIFSGTLRRDASSRFEDGNQVGVFPSVSGAWNLSSEEFWNSETINFLKLRVSYGELGSTIDQFYPGEGVFGINSATSFGSTLANGISQSAIVDDNITWETTKTFDVGLDMSLLDSRINFSLDYYSKKVDDVLVALNVPSTSGFSNQVFTNAGSIVNNGLEFSGDFSSSSEREFKYRISSNISFNLENKAEEIPNAILGPGIDEDLRVVNRTEAFQPIGFYYGYKVEDKVDPVTGDFVRIDTDGVPGITADDQTVIGDPTPDFIYGLNFTADYKNFDLALSFNGVQGNEIYNLSRYYNILWQDGGKLTDVLNSWTPTNTDTNIPRATVTDAGGNKAPSSFFVEDGSYFRLKNIELGYNIKEGVLGVDWIKDMRISLNLQNVFVLTGYTGYDPDVASSNGGRANLNSGVPGSRPDVNPLLSRGLDARAYPNARTFMLGIKANF